MNKNFKIIFIDLLFYLNSIIIFLDNYKKILFNLAINLLDSIVIIKV